MRDSYSLLRSGNIGAAFKGYLKAAEAGYETAQCNVAWLATSPEHR